MYGISQFYWARNVTLSPVVVIPFTNTWGKNLSFYFSNRVQYSNDSLDYGIPGTYSVPPKVNVSFKASKRTAEPILSNTCGISFISCHMLFFILICPFFSGFFALINIWHLLISTQIFSPLHIGKYRFHCTSMPQKVIQTWLHTQYHGSLSYHYRFLPQYGGTDPAQWDVLYLLPEDGHILHGGSSVPHQTTQEIPRIGE